MSWEAELIRQMGEELHLLRRFFFFFSWAELMKNAQKPPSGLSGDPRGEALLYSLPQEKRLAARRPHWQ